MTGRHLILSTETDLLWTLSPAMALYPNDELNHDPTNWWGPNPKAVEAMLRLVGSGTWKPSMHPPAGSGSPAQ